jgi:hypothetical protein
MVKYVAVLLAVAGMLVAVNSAEARGRRGGCPGGVCYAGGGGCPGGVCAVPVAPAKTAAVDGEPAVVTTAPAAAAPVTVSQPAPRYTNSTRRLFGRR